MIIVPDTATATRHSQTVTTSPAHGMAALDGWGPGAQHAPDRLRRFGGGTDSCAPKRARCRACSRTQVLVPAMAFPKRADSLETVFNAISLAANGAGHRTIGARIGVPETTVRGWLRRARANANTIRSNAMIAMCALDRMAGKVDPTGTQLGDMLEAVGRAAMAWDNLRPDRPEAIPRLELAALMTGGELLMPNPTRLAYWPPQ